jgi:hypothetical protein
MQPLIRPYNDHTTPQIRHLVETAQFLSVSEVEVFRLAYRYWYDRELSEALQDELIAEYLNEQKLPGWVRTYCTRVLDAAATGRFDHREFGVDRPDTIRALDQHAASLITFAGFLIYWLFLI